MRREKKKSVPFHREKMPAQSIDHWESKCYTFSSFPFHQTKYHSSSFRNRSVSLLYKLAPSTDTVCMGPYSTGTVYHVLALSTAFIITGSQRASMSVCYVDPCKKDGNRTDRTRSDDWRPLRAAVAQWRLCQVSAVCTAPCDIVACKAVKPSFRAAPGCAHAAQR